MPLVLSLLLVFTPASPRGAVATAHPLASEAAAAVLRDGGNAVDAAVAAAFVLAVVEPESSGLGGGGFALVRTARDGKVTALDFREVAPAAARPDMFAGEAEEAANPTPGSAPRPSLDGGLAVAVPGALKGYAELARRHGTLPLSRLVEPAARIAERGFEVGLHYTRAAQDRRACLAARPEAARIFLAPGPGGERVPPAPGWRLVQRDLARTLRALARDPEALYRGPLARRLAAAVAADGGVLTAADLAAYRTRERTPLEGRYRGRRVLSMPLPSSGGFIVIGLLQALEREDPRAGGYRDPRWLHAMVEIMKQLYARRAQLADPDQVPAADAVVAEVLSPAGAEALHAAVGERAAAAPAPPPARESTQTTHVSVIDAAGGAVALTTTVNYRFGACLVAPGTGILLNDEMDDFDAAPGVANVFGAVGTGANLPGPGKKPLSSMAPTLVLDEQGRPWLAVGSPGGTAIPSAVAQVISHLVDDGMTLSQAVAVPRLHHQWRPDAIQLEPGALEAETIRALEQRGHRVVLRDRPLANPQAVQRTPGGWIEAASDPAGEGVPAAP
jgi:gamma-glutamyltranspeptidase/glutathione hydrolase